MLDIRRLVNDSIVIGAGTNSKMQNVSIDLFVAMVDERTVMEIINTFHRKKRELIKMRYDLHNPAGYKEIAYRLGLSNTMINIFLRSALNSLSYELPKSAMNQLSISNY